MRLALLIICLFSILGGCAASSSHGVVVPKLVSFSGKHHSSPSAAAKSSGQPVVIYTDLGAGFFDADDMEDNDDDTNFSFKKFKAQVRYALVHTHTITTNCIRRYRLAVAAVHGNASPRYIAQQTIRV